MDIKINDAYGAEVSRNLNNIIFELLHKSKNPPPFTRVSQSNGYSPYPASITTLSSNIFVWTILQHIYKGHNTIPLQAETLHRG